MGGRCVGDVLFGKMNGMVCGRVPKNILTQVVIKIRPTNFQKFVF